MSDHEKPQSPELVEALQRHGLRHDTPSQLSDAFRLGWNARTDRIPSDPRVEALVKAARPFSQSVIQNGITVICDASPRQVLELRAALAAFKETTNE